LAIYHLTATLISRGRGQSVVGAAAYRFGVTMRDERYGVTHRYAGKRGVAYAEIIAPGGTPAWALDREMLWNRVEAAERRKDSQLARLIEIGLPKELSLEDNVALLRDYIASEFVARGMVADFCIRGDSSNPHAHILLTLRQATESGFGPKERRWNGKSSLMQWRAAWADRANEYLARAGHLVRIDHRTLEAQQIEILPGRKIGVALGRRSEETLPSHLCDRVSDQQRVAQQNGEAILEDPLIAVRALTHQRPIFTRQDVTEFLRFRTLGTQQFQAALRAVTECTELVALACEDGSQQRFTSRDMLEAEKSLARRISSMASRRGHGVATALILSTSLQFALDDDQQRALKYVFEDGDAKAMIMAAGPGKELLLSAARQAHAAAGIQTISLGAREAERADTLEPLTRETVLTVEGVQSLGLKELERIVAAADRVRAKIVLIGDAVPFRSIKIQSAFQTVFAAVGLAEAEMGGTDRGP
jgi:ATP-dependent exoDNAse (exonuclease V) alpha subunit